MPNDCASRSGDLVLGITTLIDSLRFSLYDIILFCFWTEFHNCDALKRNVLDFSGRMIFQVEVCFSNHPNLCIYINNNLFTHMCKPLRKSGAQEKFK
jgi:hypothetical protein